MKNGDILVGGYQIGDENPLEVIKRWDGSQWTTFATATRNGQPASVSSMDVLANGNVIATGAFDTISGVAASSIALWDGVAWRAIGEGSSSYYLGWGKSVFSMPDGGFIANGSFVLGEEAVSMNVARWGCITPCVADFDGSGAVSFEDFDTFVAAIESGSAAADINGDGFLTFEDFDAFVTAFEAGC